MTFDRDPDADDRFVDHLLQAEFDPATPRDHAARIAAANPAELAAAAARVQAAAEHAGKSTPRWQLHRRTMLAAAATLLAAFGVALWVHHQWADQPSGKPATASPSEQAQALLDAFHRVMPRYPENLRDEHRRHDLVARALPTLRSILAFHHAHPDEGLFRNRIIEFELYAALIGAPEELHDLQQQALAGDTNAAAKCLIIELVNQRDRGIRSSTLTELGKLVAVQPQLAASIIQCLRAAELTTAEAEQLARSIADPFVAKSLIRSAQLAATSPRRLLDQPLELYGKLSDDGRFSTNSLRGQPVLVCFWATWCQPSLLALDEIERVRQLFPELAVVGVSCDHDIRDLRNYLADHAQLDWPQLFDRTRPGWHELAFSLGVQMVPFLILIDAQGIVRDVDLADELESAVARHLGR